MDSTLKSATCQCGRSPTGNCIGWHRLTEEEYAKKLQEMEAQKTPESKEK